jgi:hypothetical protein
MITARLAGWDQQTGQGRIVLVAPEGPSAGSITIEERFEPPTSLVRIAEARGRLLDGPVSIDTGDGQCGQLVTIERSPESGGGREVIAIVLGDVSYSAILGLTMEPRHFERTTSAVKTLARQLALAMTVRRRRFMYAAPEGWTAVCRGFETEWYPPELETDPGRLTVFPAIEHHGADATDALMTLVEQQLAVSARFADADWTEAVTTTGAGLTFLRARSTAGERLAELAVAVDSRYIYAFRLEGRAQHQPALESAMAGVVPLAPAPAPNLSAVAHWAE